MDLDLPRTTSARRGGGAALTESLFVLACFVAVLVPLILTTFGWAVRRARKEASLTHF